MLINRRRVLVALIAAGLSSAGLAGTPAGAAGEGAITEFQIPTASAGPNGIVTGPDGNLWFTEGSGDKIGQITTSGTVTEWAIPTAGADPN
ncbi:MAG TPA: hypothetical protein VMD59_06120, partial [Acidimicrobiales bacterium]|nr:hypothetical protein [Acidimicrobiales bacterium]